MSKQIIGVLVMSYGTPESMDKVNEYYTHIRQGRPPSAEQLQDLTERYEAIGGLFPLRENTNKQVQALEQRLNEMERNGSSHVQFKCYQGLKHAHPLIEEGVQQMAEDGITQAVGVVLTPHYSTMSVGSYNARAEEAALQLGLKMNFVHSYHLHAPFIEALVERVETAMQQFKEEVRDQVRVLFTAHSLPEKILEANDPYPEQLLETSRKIAEKTGIHNWQFAWQSAGQTPMPWLGPDILDVLQTIHKEENVGEVLVCPIGFVSDHLEILYDIDIECQQLAKQLGMHLERTQSLNTDPRYIQTLADVVRETIDS